MSLRSRALARSGHSADVYDVAWSPDSRLLVSGAVDCTARVWDVRTRRELAKLDGHSQFVQVRGGRCAAPALAPLQRRSPLARVRTHMQGVAWDPTGAQLVTQSNDRSVRVWCTPVGAAMQLLAR